MNIKSKLLIFFPITILGIASDQIAKILTVQHLKGTPPLSYFGGFIRLQYAENRGAWGGLFGDMPDIVRQAFLIILPLALMGWLVYSIFWSKKTNDTEIWVYSLIFAGGVGNLIDRIVHGFVVDTFFMGFNHRYLSTNIFNLADVYIMIGVGLYFLVSFRHWLKTRAPKKENS